MKEEYDVIIAGGGIVGATLALALAKCSLRIGLIEASALTPAKQKSENNRAIVLAQSSQKILETLQIWQEIAKYACLIRKIHVSDQGHFGSSSILAKDEHLPALGYVLPAYELHSVLLSAVQQNNYIEVIAPAEVAAFDYQHHQVDVTTIQEGRTLTLKSKLLVACDGHNSALRQFVNIKVLTKSYHQAAVICTVDLKRPHHEIAYERFTQEGPLAMLPLLNQQCAVVWTVKENAMQQLLAYTDEQFIDKLQYCFGYRLGKIVGCSQRAAIKLQLVAAQKQIVPGMVLLGNAVHTLHPVAGQNLNLALRDLAVLAEEIHTANQKGQALGSLEVLDRYLSRRKSDQQQIIYLTDSLVAIFSNSLLPVVLARNLSLLVFERINWLKKILTKRTLGLSGKVPRLACGMNLD